MYQALVIAQVICVLLALYASFSLLNFRLGLDSRFLIMTSCCLSVYALGYLLELTASGKETALYALRFQYLGVSFVGTLFTLFVHAYCRIEIRRRISNLLILANVAILCVAVAGVDSGWYFKSAEWTEAGPFPHMEYVPGIGYLIFIGLLGISLFGAIVVALRYRNMIYKDVERRRIVYITIMCCVPYFGVAITRSGILGGYDPTSLLIILTFNLLVYNLTHYKMVNVVSKAIPSLFRDLDQGVIVADDEGRYLDSNLSAEIIFPELKTWSPGVKLQGLGVDLCSFGRSDPFERNGRFYSSLAKPLLEMHRQVGFLIVISDVTEMHSQMDEMRVLKEVADSANQAKSIFLANMSHEIRTPLNAIIGMAELAEREEAPGPVKDYLSQIKSSGKMLLDIICETLDLTKVESGKFDLLPVEFNTLEFLNGVINVINMRIGDKELDFNVDVDPNLPITLFGDDIRIRQIMINFLGNAVKYTNAGHITFKVDFEKTDKSVIVLKVSVEDTGNGISKEDQEKLFHPFSQVDLKKNRKVVGTGLGLAISAKIIDLMGGNYRVESEYGEGSTFYFSIPVYVVDDSPICDSEKRKLCQVPKYATFNLFGIEKEDEDDVGQKLPQFKNKKVLVVDDNRVNVKVLSAFLKQFGIEPDICFNGPEAVEYALKEEYDLIFMDHLMPNMDGAEAASKIRKNEAGRKRAVIIACSANVMKGADELFLENGMDDYISKPIQLHILEKKLLKYLA